jgi:glycosyltransferase involved in cell wall biosynthesis
MKIKVTLGLCVKNSETTVEETVKSLISQDFPHESMELIVVDGESKDKTLSIIQNSLLASDIQAKMYNDQGKGLGPARQIVADNASGRYIVWVDGDVVLPKNYVQKQVEFMDRNPRVGAAQGNWGISETKSFVGALENLSELEHKHEYRNLHAIGTIRGIYRVKAIKQAGGFDKCIKGASEDLDLSHRIWKNGWLLAKSQVTLYHRFRETWSDLWKEYSWWGYGDHYISHKHSDAVIMWQTLPIVRAVGGFLHAFTAYKLAHQKISFILPLHHFFKASAWWFGFLKSHRDGYGHKIKREQVSSHSVR